VIEAFEAFEPFDYVVGPSASCAGMVKVHYPTLLADDSAFGPRARALAAKTFELTRFLVEVLKGDGVEAH
jgi:L-lactate dehydrogenase complex protein LldE